jgi:hypothetical protein
MNKKELNVSAKPSGKPQDCVGIAEAHLRASLLKHAKNAISRKTIKQKIWR